MMKSIGIGGQAVVNGVMLKQDDTYAIAIKNEENDEIEVTYDKYKGIMGTGILSKIPILRGIFKIIDELTLKSRVLIFSADYYEENSKNGKSSKSGDTILGLIVILALILSIAAFIIAPIKVSLFIGKKYAKTQKSKVIYEVGIRIVLFIVYMIILSFIKEIKKISMYRGACNKVINCIENGQDLTVENVKRCSSISKNNFSAFLVSILFLSSVVFSFVYNNDMTIKMLLRFASVFFVASISYEIVNLFKEKKGPGIFFGLIDTFVQKLITKKPNDEMIKVAICAATAILEKDNVISNVKKESDNENFASYNDDLDNIETEYANTSSSMVSFEGNNEYNNDGYHNNDMYGHQETYNDVPSYAEVPSYENANLYGEPSYEENMYPAVPSGYDNHTRYEEEELDLPYNNGYDDTEYYSQSSYKVDTQTHTPSYDNKEYNRALAYGNIQAKSNNNMSNHSGHNYLGNNMQYENGLELDENELYEDDMYNDSFGYNEKNDMLNLEDFEYSKNNHSSSSYNTNSIGNYADLDMDGYDSYSSNNEYYTEKKSTVMPYDDFDDDNDEVLDALDRMFDDEY